MDIIIFLTFLFVDYVGAFLTLSSMSILYSLAGSSATADCILQTSTCVLLSGLWMHPVPCTLFVSCIGVHVAMWTMKQFDRLVSQLSKSNSKAGFKGLLRKRRLFLVSILAILVVAPLAVAMATSTSIRITASGYDLDLRAGKSSGSLILPPSVVSLVDMVSFVKHGARRTQLWKCVDEYGSVSLHSRWTVPMEFYMMCTDIKVSNILVISWSPSSATNTTIADTPIRKDLQRGGWDGTCNALINGTLNLVLNRTWSDIYECSM
jgi:hypothetical protein